MVSGGACLRAAAAVTIFAVLVMSSQGHRPRKRPLPLCSDCPSLCNTNCTAMAIANCTSECNFQPGCNYCKSQVRQACCQNFCSSSNGTSSFSCCPNECIISGGNCTTCTCENCDSAVQNSCISPCSELRCQSCKMGIGQQCYPACISTCNDHCVKKHC